MKQPPLLISLRKYFLDPDHSIFIILAILLVIGFIVNSHYGESWDDGARYDYAQRSLAAYSGQHSDLADEKGAFFSMLALLGSKVFQVVVAGWKSIDGWHFMNFLSFLMGVYFFYRLCRRLIQPAPAYAATLLFCTQPLVWGHAFINPKDTPFMAFFIASLSLGLDMADRVRSQSVRQNQKLGLGGWIRSQLSILAGEWRSAGKFWRVAWGTLGALLVGIILGFEVLRSAAGLVVRKAYETGESSLVGALFIRIAQGAGDIPLEDYLAKASILSAWFLLGIGLFLLLAWIFTSRKVFPTLIDKTFAAGCFLGFCSAIRSLGPASGLLVIVFLVVTSGKKSLPVLLKYLLVAGITAFLFWPFLWGNPFENFYYALTQASQFPWSGNILFAGQLYTEDTLPATFLPALFGLQFTEPALLLILAGAGLALVALVRRPERRLDMLLLGAWLIAPPLAAILLKSTIYNNFRQFLFVVPALFVVAGLALQYIWEKLHTRGILFAGLSLILLLPGLYWDTALHPYEYIYYNNLVGGVEGAFREYELDYWETSNKEAMEYLNQIAPQNAVVVVKGAYQSARTYARKDLTVVNYVEGVDSQADYAILSTQFFVDAATYPDSPVIHQVTRGSAVLTVIKLLNPLLTQ